MTEKQVDKENISKLLDIIARLRDPERGCPWDLAQRFDTIAPYTVEEAYEVADAIERGAIDELPDELGDLLFQVVLHARMAEELGRFDFGDVVTRICEKLIRRHPHVFGEAQLDSASDSSRAWEEIKRQERTQEQGVLGDIPLALPALTRAVKLGRRAASVGFDWRDLAPVRDKLSEELAELDEAIETGSPPRTAEEIGDLLFSVTNLCRHLELDPEQCLRGANARFQRRFEHVEAAVERRGGNWDDFDLDQLDAFWIAAKAVEPSA